ncbi:SAM-dependent methyltransferase [Nocardia vaccinii]|uniref:SAM-dependent methyltransferase n=1 Tax=Nocardia vaccinii TaxID=1822 RepID=UPI00083788FD|nr:SAM-dependent methyltransferase [Nocardia vaccinii]
MAGTVDSGAANGDTAAKVSGTAVGPMLIAAAEQWFPAERRLVDDDLAAAMLPGALRAALRPRPLRRWLVSLTDREAPGLWNSIACRKRYIDDRLAEAIDAGIEAVVLLGAGFDTRGYRVAARIADFEVDTPGNLDVKRRRMPLPDNVVQVPIDFETEDLGAVLTAHGHRPGTRTMYVWEGVTQYLTEPAVRATLDCLSGAASGSRLAFTYVRKDFLDGTRLYDAPRMRRRLVERERIWRYGLNPGDVAQLLAEYGWGEAEQVGPEEYLSRYVRPAGRSGPVSAIERCVFAIRR